MVTPFNKYEKLFDIASAILVRRTLRTLHIKASSLFWVNADPLENWLNIDMLGTDRNIHRFARWLRQEERHSFFLMKLASETLNFPV